MQLAHIHGRKEIENYLLLPGALARAAAAAIADRARRHNETADGAPDIPALLTTITDRHKKTVQAQYVGRRLEHLRKTGKDASTLAAEAIAEFEGKWHGLDERLTILAELRQEIQSRHQISLTDYKIINACKPADIPQDLRDLLACLEAFRCSALQREPGVADESSG